MRHLLWCRSASDPSPDCRGETTEKMDETVVDFLSSDAFVTVFSVVVAAASLFWALRTDTGKRIDKLEGRLVHRIDKSEERLVQRIDKGDEALGRRIDKQEERLGRRIDKGDEALGHRIDRQEERARANHAELLGKIAEFAREIGELKATVSAVNAKLDERSSPRPLVVRETGKDYPVGGESTGRSETPEGDPADAAASTSGGDPATDLRVEEQGRHG